MTAQNAQPDTDTRIDNHDLLWKIYNLGYFAKDYPLNKVPEIDETDQAIKDLIAEQVSAARIDELNRASKSMTDSPYERLYFTKRRAELEKGQK